MLKECNDASSFDIYVIEMYRRYDIDWIRVIVFDILVVYHIGMFFVPWDWEIKNNELIEGLKWPMIFVNRWRLSILFVISGIGTKFALSKRSHGQFILERIQRLFLPLLTGTLLIVAPQIYLVRLSEGDTYSSFLDFYPHFFKGIYPQGNFSWAHLWFLPYLLTITLTSLPILLYFRKRDNQVVLWLQKLIQRLPIGLYVFIIPLFLIELYLEPRYPANHSLWGDWYALSHYFSCFLSGYILVSLGDVFWDAVKKVKNKAAFTGVISFLVMIWTWENHPSSFWVPLFASFNRWSWILAFFGFAACFLNKESEVIKYRNQAVYPFYILHQTVTIGIGFYLMNSALANSWKFLILLLGTYLGCWVLYEFGIKRISILRLLFGIKAKTAHGKPG